MVSARAKGATTTGHKSRNNKWK